MVVDSLEVAGSGRWEPNATKKGLDFNAEAVDSSQGKCASLGEGPGLPTDEARS